MSYDDLVVFILIKFWTAQLSYLTFNGRLDIIEIVRGLFLPFSAQSGPRGADSPRDFIQHTENSYSLWTRELKLGYNNPEFLGH